MDNEALREAAAAAFNFFLLDSDSDSSSESDFEEVDAEEEEVRPNIPNFMLFFDQLNDPEFRQHFRLTRPTFQHLLSRIEEELKNNHERGRFQIPPRMQLAITLWRFGTPDSFRSICLRFSIGKATAQRSVRRVTIALEHLAPAVIQWPTERGNYHQVVNGFQEMGFPNTIGAVDGCLIRIPKPQEDGRAYICRKNFAALNLTAVVDHQRLFTFVYAGEVGSCHDAEVFRRSRLSQYIEEEDKFPNNTHIIGDKAYALHPKVMTPYRDNGHMTPQQINYNYCLSRARSIVERAFGLLKGRWRCLLDNFAVRHLGWASRYILAICVLHNICIMQDDLWDVMPPPEDEDEQIPIPHHAPGQIRHLAEIKREEICLNLPQRPRNR